MKKLMMLLLLLVTATVMNAKDIRTLVVTTNPQMHCPRCENRVKTGLKDVKGIKSVETSVADQTVTIQYDAKKTSEEKLMNAMETVGFKPRKLAPGETVKKEEHECGMENAEGGCKE
jgi:copper chaperone CopZ